MEKEKQEKEIINNAKIKARDILLEAKKDANEIIKRMSSSANTKDLNNLRNSLNTKIGNMKLENVSSSIATSSNEIDTNKLKIGQEVLVPSFNTTGIILSKVSKNNEVHVQIGSMKMNLPISSIQLSKNKTSPNITLSNQTSKSRNIKPEINVIGMNVEEATFVIDKFLDDCTLSKLETVRIIHGKGTGKLKNGIHQFLKSNSHVKSFRMGTFGEGEMGVTVVTLK